MSAKNFPLYGRFDFESMDELITRLIRISENHLEGTPFMAYLVTRENQKYYGLTYDELVGWYHQLMEGISSISISASTASGKVIRVNIRFYATSATTNAQFIISTGSQQTNQKIKSLLKGGGVVETLQEAIPEPVTNEPAPSNLPPVKIRPKPSLHYPEFTYTQPTITVTDYFYFDPNTAPDTIVMLLNRLSETFMNGAYFHMRLETTDGDYHMNMDRLALRYMFHQRRDTMLMLYMDAATLSGQWINLRLSYHPLASGPNGEVDITSGQTDEILSMIQDTIGIDQPPSALPERLNETFQFDERWFSIDGLIKVFNEISRSYLHRIPPVAFLSTFEGHSYTGLSFYQLKKVYERHEGVIEVLSVGITKIMTGQTLSLMLQFTTNDDSPYGSLSMMWGNKDKHEAVRELIWDKMELMEYVAGRKIEDSLFSGISVPRKSTCMVALPWEASWADNTWRYIQKSLSAVGMEAVDVRSTYAHKHWENTMTAITSASTVIAELTFRHPDVLYKMGIAQAMGKQVIILVQDTSVIPEEFKKFPAILYEYSEQGLALMAEELEYLLVK